MVETYAIVLSTIITFMEDAAPQVALPTSNNTMVEIYNCLIENTIRLAPISAQRISCCKIAFLSTSKGLPWKYARGRTRAKAAPTHGNLEMLPNCSTTFGCMSATYIKRSVLYFGGTEMILRREKPTTVLSKLKRSVVERIAVTIIRHQPLSKSTADRRNTEDVQ